MMDATLNQKILSLAPKFDAKEFAPDTFEKLNSHVGRLVVWSGASDNTIYGDPRVNHAFRAWHDSLHLKLNADFTLEGERRVALEQARLIGGDTYGHIIMGEVVGQAEMHALTGQFPADQLQFMINYLKSKGVI